MIVVMPAMVIAVFIILKSIDNWDDKGLVWGIGELIIAIASINKKTFSFSNIDNTEINWVLFFVGNILLFEIMGLVASFSFGVVLLHLLFPTYYIMYHMIIGERLFKKDDLWDDDVARIVGVVVTVIIYIACFILVIPYLPSLMNKVF